jgi:hypothetical protein
MLTVVTQGAEISCPNLICANPVPVGHEVVPDKCFQHDKRQPNEQILIYDCKWYQYFEHSRFTAG